MKDFVGNEIKVGSVVASPHYDYGTTFRVVAFHGAELVLRRVFRGRISFRVSPLGFRVVG